MIKSVIKATVAVLALVPLLVLAAPGIPHQFYGTVSFSNGPTPDGLVVEAKVGGVIVGTAATKDGKYGYSPGLLFASKADGEWTGETVSFFVSGVDTGETYSLTQGGYTNLNLTVPGSASPVPAPAPSSGGGGGGGGGGNPPPATTQLSAAAQKVDANKDNKIDVLDFNTLMVHWGKTEVANVADFTGDGKVDIFDFNALMIQWTVTV